MNVMRWGVAPVVRGATNGGLMFALGYAIAGLPLALILGAIGLGLGLVHGFSMAIGDAIPWGRAAGWVGFVVDNTWGVVNSFAASIFLVVNYITLNPISRTGAGSGALVLRRGILPGFATTIGNVMAGEDSVVRDHELLHVLQSRIFGPLYLPLVVVSYVVVAIVPYWLIFHDHGRWPIRGFGTYFLNGVYPHTWHEEWAYRAEGP